MDYQRGVKLLGDSMSEECGIIGVYSSEKRELARSIYYGLYALQHRGQEACGIALSSDNKILYHKNLGLVSEVFSESVLESLPEADIAIGHV
ncbi:MAG: amidophosphoribosyltransferase, partial [Clostridia bacterium]|nr:amidophosphoribosyltransferase [Clostridia bacterium]